MRRTRSVVAAGLVAVACRATPAVPSRAGEAAQSADTTFVELGRFEERGTRNSRGSCEWGTTVPPQTWDTPKGALREFHSVSVNQECVRLNAYGYRWARPPMDTAGTESRTSTRTLTADSLRPQPKRP
jgi:hypothetical protein